MKNELQNSISLELEKPGIFLSADQKSPTKSPKKNKKWLIAGLVILIAGVIVVLFRLLFSFLFISVDDFSELRLRAIQSWNSYRNEEYGFEFKYPKEWAKQSSSAFDTSFSSPDLKYEGAVLDEGGEVWVSVLANPQKQTLLQFIESEQPYTEEAIQPIGGRQTVKIYKNIDQTPTTSVYIRLSEENVVKLSLTAGKNANTDLLNPLFTQIISTLKFSGDIIANDWQVHTNEKFRYEFKYPPGWQVKTEAEKTRTDITKETYSNGTYTHDISVSIVVYPNLEKQEVSKEWLINWMYQMPITMPQNWEREIQSTSFLGSPAVTYDQTLYFARDEQIYSIGWSVEGTAIDDSANKSNELVSSAKEFYDQILSTFRFVDETIPKRDNSNISISLSNRTQTLSSDLNLLVTAPDGKKSGRDPRTGKVYDEIEGASSGPESLCADSGPPSCMSRIVFYYIHPQKGKYSIQVISLTQDTISLDPRVIDIHGEFIDFMQYPEYTLSSDIGVNQVIEYILDYDNEEISKSTLTLVDDK